MRVLHHALPLPHHPGRRPDLQDHPRGHRGRHPRIGRHLITVNSEEDVIRVVERIITWIHRQASSGSLLPEQLDELEFDAFRKDMHAMIFGEVS